jgi:membrane protein
VWNDVIHEWTMSLYAMGLVYTTLLSIVPVLAVSFSVLKAFGVHNQLRPLLLNFLEPLGEKGAQLAEQVIGFVENVQVGVLGALGIGMLFYTVISLVQKIEGAFNAIWRVSRERSFARRFSDFLSVLIVGPVLVFAAFGVTGTLANTGPAHWLMSFDAIRAFVSVAGRLTPYLLVVATFFLIYIFVPNTRVRAVSALIGAVAAGILWQIVGWVFSEFIAGSTQYTAIYSGFAIVIVAMSWLYLAWLILLIGSAVAFYHQFPHYATSPLVGTECTDRVRNALRLMLIVGYRHATGRPAPTREDLADASGLACNVVDQITTVLVKAGLLLQTGTSQPALVPASAPARIPLQSVIEAVRPHAPSSPRMTSGATANNEEHALETIFTQMDAAVGLALEGKTLQDLLELPPEAQKTAPPPPGAERVPAGALSSRPETGID